MRRVIESSFGQFQNRRAGRTHHGVSPQRATAEAHSRTLTVDQPRRRADRQGAAEFQRHAQLRLFPRRYGDDNRLRWQYDLDERRVVANLVRQTTLNAEELRSLWAVTTGAELQRTLQSLESPTPAQEALLAALGTAGYSMIDDEALRRLRTMPALVLGTIRTTLLYAALEAWAGTAWLAAYVLGRPQNRAALAADLRSSGAHAAAAGVAIWLGYFLILIALAYLLVQMLSGATPRGTSSQASASCRWRPAGNAASAPNPQNRSKRSGPRMAPPVSCASTSRASGAPVAGCSLRITSGAPSGMKRGSIATE